MKNTFIKIRKSNFKSVFFFTIYRIIKYKNVFNINKLPKRTYNLITKRKYCNKPKTFHYKRIYKHLRIIVFTITRNLKNGLINKYRNFSK